MVLGGRKSAYHPLVSTLLSADPSPFSATNLSARASSSRLLEPSPSLRSKTHSHPSPSRTNNLPTLPSPSTHNNLRLPSHNLRLPPSQSAKILPLPRRAAIDTTGGRRSPAVSYACAARGEAGETVQGVLGRGDTVQGREGEGVARPRRPLGERSINTPSQRPDLRPTKPRGMKNPPPALGGTDTAAMVTERESWAAERERWRIEREGLEGQITALEAERGRREGVIVGFEAERVGWGTEKEGLEGRLREGRTEVEGKETEIVALGESITDLNSQIDTLKASNTTANGTIQQLTEDWALDGHERDIELTELGEEKKRVEMEAFELGMEVGRLEGELADAEEGAGRYKAEIASLGETVNELRTQIDTLKESNTSANAKIQELQEDWELDRVERDLELKLLAVEKTRVQKEVERLGLEVGRLEGELSDAGGESARNTEEITSLRQTVSDQRNQIDLLVASGTTDSATIQALREDLDLERAERGLDLRMLELERGIVEDEAYLLGMDVERLEGELGDAKGGLITANEKIDGIASDNRQLRHTLSDLVLATLLSGTEQRCLRLQVARDLASASHELVVARQENRNLSNTIQNLVQQRDLFGTNIYRLLNEKVLIWSSNQQLHHQGTNLRNALLASRIRSAERGAELRETEERLIDVQTRLGVTETALLYEGWRRADGEEFARELDEGLRTSIAQVQELVESSNTDRATIRILRVDIRDRDNRITSLESDILAFRTTTASLNLQITSGNTAKTKLRKQLDNANINLNIRGRELQEEADGWRELCEEARRERDKGMKELERKLQEQETSYETLAKGTADAETINLALVKDKENLSTELANIKTSLSSAKDSVKRLQKRVLDGATTLRVRMREAEEETKGWREMCEEEKGRVGEGLERISSLENRIENLRTSYTAERTASLAKIDSITSNYAELAFSSTETILALRNQVTQSEVLSASLQIEVSSARAIVRSRDSRISALGSAIVSLRDTASSELEIKQGLQASLEDTRDRLKTAVSMKEALQDQNGVLAKKVQAWRSTAGRLREEIRTRDVTEVEYIDELELRGIAIRGCEESLRESMKEEMELQETINNRDAKIDSQSTLIGQYEVLMGASTTSVNEKIKEIERLGRKLRDKGAEVVKLTGEKATFSGQIAALRKEVEKHPGQLATLQAKLDAATTNLEMTNTSLAKAKSTSSSDSSTISRLRSERNKAETDLQTERDSLSRTKASHRLEVQRLNGQVSTKEKSLTSKTEEVTRLKSAASAAEKKTVEKEKDWEEEREKAGKLLVEAKKAGVSASVTSLQTKLSKSEEAVKKEKKEVGRLTTVMGTMKVQHGKVVTACQQQAVLVIQQVRNQHATLRTSILGDIRRLRKSYPSVQKEVTPGSSIPAVGDVDLLLSYISEVVTDIINSLSSPAKPSNTRTLQGALLREPEIGFVCPGAWAFVPVEALADKGTAQSLCTDFRTLVSEDQEGLKLFPWASVNWAAIPAQITYRLIELHRSNGAAIRYLKNPLSDYGDNDVGYVLGVSMFASALHGSIGWLGTGEGIGTLIKLAVDFLNTIDRERISIIGSSARCSMTPLTYAELLVSATNSIRHIILLLQVLGSLSALCCDDDERADNEEALKRITQAIPSLAPGLVDFTAENEEWIIRERLGVVWGPHPSSDQQSYDLLTIFLLKDPQSAKDIKSFLPKLTATPDVSGLVKQVLRARIVGLGDVQECKAAVLSSHKVPERGSRGDLPRDLLRGATVVAAARLLEGKEVEGSKYSDVRKWEPSGKYKRRVKTSLGTWKGLVMGM